MTDLLPIETINAVEIFDGEQDTALRALLDRVRDEVTGEVFDVSTTAGRKLCAAVAYKVARSKTAIDEAGKALVADWKEKCKVIDSRRKMARDELDALKDEVRRPVTEWEADQERIAQEAADAERKAAEEADRQRIAEIEARETEIRAREEAVAAKDREQAAREAAEAAAKAQAERDARVAAEAEQRAAKAAQERIEAAERAAREADERAARAKQEAEAEAKRKAEAEALRLKREQESAEALERERQQNRKHRGKIHAAARDSIASYGNIPEDCATEIVKAIASGMVPAVTINY